MGNRNQHNVAIPTDRETTHWAFILPSKVETCDEQASEMVARCEALFGAFEEFLVPTEINYNILRFPPEQRLPVGLSDNEHLEVVSRKVRNESGISVEKFRKSTHMSEPGSRWIPRVGFDGNKVKIRLENGDVYASYDDYTVEYHFEEPTGNRPTRSPLECRLLHAFNRAYPTIEANYVTSVLVSPVSDIWFEDTDIGAVNQQYLSSFLGRLEETFPVEAIERTSDWMPVSNLEAIY